jgi:hypothetical protein
VLSPLPLLLLLPPPPPPLLLLLLLLLLPTMTAPLLDYGCSC